MHLSHNVISIIFVFCLSTLRQTVNMNAQCASNEVIGVLYPEMVLEVAMPACTKDVGLGTIELKKSHNNKQQQHYQQHH